MNLLYDLWDALRAGLREFRRLRWVRQYTRHIKTPFEG